MASSPVALIVNGNRTDPVYPVCVCVKVSDDDVDDECLSKSACVSLPPP